MLDAETLLDDFEAQWQRSIDGLVQEPKIEAFLNRVDVQYLENIFRELLFIELEMRRITSRVAMEEYQQRFPQLRQQLEDVFDKHLGQFEGDSKFDDPSLNSCSQVQVSQTQSHKWRPRFKILRPHREGGLGRVWIAQDSEVDREVALKEIKGQYSDLEEVRARFLTEAELTGKLEHPGIVPVYGLGKYPDGRPYYAMRFIRGTSLQEAIGGLHQARPTGRTKLTNTTEFRRLLRRLISVCQTVHYAHSQGIIHRDLKPANIMLGPFGETLVVDWGLAKIIGVPGAPHEVKKVNSSLVSDVFVKSLSKECLEQRRSSAAHESTDSPERIQQAVERLKIVHETENGTNMGTPAYMSPEQAMGLHDSLTAVSDVYSLGAVLYQLLTGRAPFSDEDGNRILERVISGHIERPRMNDRTVPKALDAISTKAMAREPSERYASALELAEDLEQWLDDLPISALPDKWVNTQARWLRKNRNTVGIILIALTILTVVSIAGAAWIERARVEAVNSKNMAARALYAYQVQEAGRNAFANPELAVDLLMDPSICEESMREFSWRFHYRATQREVANWNAHPTSLSKSSSRWICGFSSDGQAVISVSSTGQICVWDVETGQQLESVSVDGDIQSVGLSSDSKLLACSMVDEIVRLYDAENWRLIDQFYLPRAPVTKLVFSPDQSSLICLQIAEDASQVTVYDLQARSIRYQVDGPISSRACGVSPDSRLLAVGGGRNIATADGETGVGDVAVYNLETGDRTDRFKVEIHNPEYFDDHVNCISFLENDRLVLSTLGAIAVYRYKPDGLAPGESGWQVDGDVRIAHNGTTHAIAVGTLGGRLKVATAGIGVNLRQDLQAPYRPVVFWEGDSLREITYLTGLSGQIVDICFESSGHYFAALNDSGDITTFDISAEWTQETFECGYPVHGFTFSHDGKYIYSLAGTNRTGGTSVSTWNVKRRQPISERQVDESTSYWLPSCKATGGIYPPSKGRSISIVNPQDGAVMDSIDLRSDARLLAVCPRGKYKALATGSTSIVVSEIPQRKAEWIMSLDPDRSPVMATISEDGKQLAVVDQHYRLTVFNITKERRIFKTDLDLVGVTAMAFSHNGKTLAIASMSANTVRLDNDEFGSEPTDLHQVNYSFQDKHVSEPEVIVYDLTKKAETCRLKGHKGSVIALAFSSDDKTIASGGVDWEVKLWDPVCGIGMGSIPVFGVVSALEFGTDDRSLGAACSNGSIHLWTAEEMKRVVELEAKKLVHSVWERIPVKSEVSRMIANSGQTDDAVRMRAQEIANNLSVEPSRIAFWAWNIVAQRDLKPSVYRLALKAIDQLSADDQKVPVIKAIRAAATYRSGDTAAALQCWPEMEEFESQTPISIRLQCMAILAMAYWEAGETDRAVQVFEQIRELKRTHPVMTVSEENLLDQLLIEAAELSLSVNFQTMTP